MKKKVLFLASVVICISILASGTAAFFTAEVETHSVITTGAVDIEIEEWKQEGENRIPYPADTKLKIMPGTATSKIAIVRNLGAKAYIRAKVELTVKKSDDTVMEVAPETLAKLIKLNVNETLWLRKEGDGDWWYYAEAVNGGSPTEALFTEVAFDGPNMSNEYQNCTLEINVKAQAIQTANNKDHVLTVTDWPAE